MMTDGAAECAEAGWSRSAGRDAVYVCPARDQLFLMPV